MFSALRLILLFAALYSISVNAAEPNALNLEKGEGYATITPAQPTQDPNKVEVIEFFWYGCPHCYRLEPYLTEWLKKLPPNVQFIRQPAVFGPRWAPHARAYFTAEALGVIENIHADLFDAIQNKRRPLSSEEELAEFFEEHGVDKDQFRQAYHSFIVDTKMRQAGAMSARYGVSGVPAIMINGKYKTNGTLAKNFPNLIAVMDYLIASESKDSP
jgi:protein dithiol oxidoreductase (disulfide-forming)